MTITKKSVRVLIVLAALFSPTVALADGGELGITLAGPGPKIVTNPATARTDRTYILTQTLPYSFTVYDYKQPVETLPIDFYKEEFVNQVGSIAVTLVALVSEYSLISGIAILVTALFAMIWLFAVVMDRPVSPQEIREEYAAGYKKVFGVEPVEESSNAYKDYVKRYRRKENRRRVVGGLKTAANEFRRMRRR